MPKNPPGRPPVDQPSPDTIYFYLPFESYGILSNWHPSPFTVFLDVFSNVFPDRPKNIFKVLGPRSKHESLTFNCVEQFYQFSKAVYFNDDKVASAILATEDPKEQKQLSVNIKHFNDYKWCMVQNRAATIGIYHKFWQNKEMRTFLLGTEDKVLVEASSRDSNWGIAFSKAEAEENRPKWGSNLLGQCLMQVRQVLRLQDKGELPVGEWSLHEEQEMREELVRGITTLHAS